MARIPNANQYHTRQRPRGAPTVPNDEPRARIARKQHDESSFGTALLWTVLGIAGLLWLLSFGTARLWTVLGIAGLLWLLLRR